MHSEVVNKMRDKNYDHCSKQTEKINDLVWPMVEKIDKLKKWDEAVYILIYHRKWNDIITQASCVHVRSSSLTSSDVHRINNMWYQWLIMQEDQE